MAGEIGEFIKSAAQREGTENLERGSRFSLGRLKENPHNKTLNKDFTFEKETLLRANVTPITEGSPIHSVDFELTADSPSVSKDQTTSLLGERGENLIIVAEDEHGKFRISPGEIDDKSGARIVNFDKWYPVDSLQRKPDLLRMLKTNPKQHQPLTSDKSRVGKYKFLII